MDRCRQSGWLKRITAKDGRATARPIPTLRLPLCVLRGEKGFQVGSLDQPLRLGPIVFFTTEGTEDTEKRRRAFLWGTLSQTPRNSLTPLCVLCVLWGEKGLQVGSLDQPLRLRPMIFLTTERTEGTAKRRRAFLWGTLSQTPRSSLTPLCVLRVLVVKKSRRPICLSNSVAQPAPRRLLDHRNDARQAQTLAGGKLVAEDLVDDVSRHLRDLFQRLAREPAA